MFDGGMAADEWSALMAAAQRGDGAAYHALLRAAAPWLRGLARRALREAADADDVVQETLLTMHAMRHAYDPRRPFRPWLAGIARHRIADRRRRARGQMREVALEPLGETLAAPSEDVESRCDVPAMHRALGTLPVGQRCAIELLKLREMSLREAAAVTGMTAGALKVATHRGLARMRLLLAEGAA